MPRPRLRAATRGARDIPGGGRLELDLELADEHVPAILQIPSAPTTVPAVLLLHGFTSHKERMADTVGRSLLRRGVATLAIDLPLHGAREGRFNELSARSLVDVVQKWRLALREARQAIGYLAEHEAVNAQRIAIVGYSLGAFVAVGVAAECPQVRVVVLAAGGDLPSHAKFTPLVRMVADPLQAVRKLDGRPLLMVNGDQDSTVTPEQAERLFAAAQEPKTLRWYHGGHWLPTTEIEQSADWLVTRLTPSDARTS